jgi:hypothetical protein
MLRRALMFVGRGFMFPASSIGHGFCVFLVSVGVLLLFFPGPFYYEKSEI